MKVSDLIRKTFLFVLFTLLLCPGNIFAEGSHSHSEKDYGYQNQDEESGEFDEYGEEELFEGSYIQESRGGEKKNLQDMEGSH